MGRSNPPPKSGARCPVCSAPTDPAVRPFCSSRCADVDLLRWLRGGYAIPGGQQDADEDGDDTQASQQPGKSGDEREQS